MIFGQDRQELRKMYADAWQKHLDGRPMSPLEIQIASVVAGQRIVVFGVLGDDGCELDFER